MHAASLNTCLKTTQAAKHCAQIGYSLAEFGRLTACGFGDSARWSEDKEFHFLWPKSDDADRLVRVAEVIMHDGVTLPATRKALVSYRSHG